MFNPLTDFEDLSGKVIIITTRVRSDFHSNDRSHSFLAKRLVMPQLNTLLAPVLMYLGSRTEEKGGGAITKLQEEGIGSGDVVEERKFNKRNGRLVDYHETRGKG